jgi:hypothetical protein
MNTATASLAKSTAEPREPRAPEKKPVKPLEGGRLKTLRSSEADYGNVFGAMLSNEVPFEHLLDPGFWSNHANKMYIGDTIEASNDATCVARVRPHRIVLRATPR